MGRSALLTRGHARSARWRTASYSRMPAATEAFSDATRPSIGISTSTSHSRWTSGAIPSPFGADHERDVAREVAPRCRAARPQPIAAPKTQMPDFLSVRTACATLATRAIGTNAVAPADDLRTVGFTPALRRSGRIDRRRARALGRAHDRADVVRIGHVIEHDEERRPTRACPARSPRRATSTRTARRTRRRPGAPCTETTRRTRGSRSAPARSRRARARAGCAAPDRACGRRRRGCARSGSPATSISSTACTP